MHSHIVLNIYFDSTYLYKKTFIATCFSSHFTIKKLLAGIVKNATILKKWDGFVQASNEICSDCVEISATWQRILHLFQWMESLILFCYMYLNWLKKYNSTCEFQTWLFVHPLPFRNLPLSDPSTPLWGGYQYFLEPHMVHFSVCFHWVVETFMNVCEDSKCCGDNSWLLTTFCNFFKTYCLISIPWKEREPRFVSELIKQSLYYRLFSCCFLLLANCRRRLTACPILESEDYLRLLNFQHNLISRISHLENLKRLIFLDFYDNQIEEISGLSALRSLRVLMLGKNK